MVMTQEMLESDDVEQFERQMDRMLHSFFPHEHRARPRFWRPPTDVYETDDAIIVKIEIAGMHPDDFRIAFVDRLLTVTGTRQDMDAKLSYHCLEIPYGEFRTEVFLGGTYIAENIEAKYDNGLLYITLPKAKQEHRVPVRVQAKAD
ncbi:MAG: Hsp20/alpha crystallin family protein [Anaerolineales bacterium]|nr:Hsp20/alpha crystallin family protein [Anaerolineales bacterium]